MPGESASWLLQLTGSPARPDAVDRAIEYTDPGYLVYSDVLPVQLGDGRRYLVSARVQRLLGPDGTDVPLHRRADRAGRRAGLPGRATVTATLRATESLPQGPGRRPAARPGHRPSPTRAIRWSATSPARARRR